MHNYTSTLVVHRLIIHAVIFMAKYVRPQALFLLLIVLAVIDWSQASKNQIKETLISLDQVQNVHHHQKRANSDQDDDNNLRTSLIIVFTLGITIGLLLIMTICAVCMLHRARYGRFCCLEAKIRYPRQALNFESDCSEKETELTGPPQYDATYLVNESPPVYEDALQDI
ncbi:uncharacterized protein LOC135342974 [Halichondria panicea]|uniref:uncharacterized protein LOC135342974 n=1 Tax=Halichondria panicea TaxID=6063 RepID=UPI00312B96FE